MTELTLAATRDTIRLLSWLKSHAPASRLIVVANRTPAAGQEEVARREFEKSIEHKVDFILPLDQKSAAQSAKLGKPLAEVTKATKLGQTISAMADAILGGVDTGGKRNASLFNRLSEIKTLIPKKRKD